MPRGDKTGPEGAGPMKGKRIGFCTGNVRAGWQIPSPGRPGRLGRARGKGWGFHRFPRDYRTVAPTQAGVSQKSLIAEREILRDQLEAIEQKLSAIKAKQEK